MARSRSCRRVSPRLSDRSGKSQLGEWILQPNATAISRNPIISQAIHLKDQKPIRYDIKKTGFYCIWTYKFTENEPYRAIVEFRNAYGELPAAQIAKLPFYGGLTIVYAVIGA